MELRVRDVAFNMRYKGTKDENELNTMHQCKGCKSDFRIGESVCGGQDCKDCYDTLMVDLVQRDDNARNGEYYDDEDEEERNCDNCNGENCDGCDDFDEWERE